MIQGAITAQGKEKKTENADVHKGKGTLMVPAPGPRPDFTGIERGEQKTHCWNTGKWAR